MGHPAGKEADPMTDIKAGDEVRVFSRSGRDPKPDPGTIVKVGRTLVEVRYLGRVEKFRIDTRRINDNYGDVWFETPEDADRREREIAACVVLRDAGIEFRLGRRFTLEQVEALAEVARSFTAAAEHPVTSRCECGRYIDECRWREGYGSHTNTTTPDAEDAR
jgi:hypothetical protein